MIFPFWNFALRSHARLKFTLIIDMFIDTTQSNNVFLCIMIRVFSDKETWAGSFQRNATLDWPLLVGLQTFQTKKSPK